MKPTVLLFIGLVLAIYVAIHYYLFLRGWQALSYRPWMRIGFVIIFLLLAVSFPLAMLGEGLFPYPLLKVFNSVGMTWLVLMLYFFLLTLFSDLVRVIDHYTHFLTDMGDTRLPFRRMLLFFACIVIVGLIALGGYVRFSHPVVVEAKLNRNSSSVPSALRIVVAGDLHLGYMIQGKTLDRFVELINQQEADYILLCGDLIDRSLVPLQKENLHLGLQKLRAKKGVFAVAGNHEYITGYTSELEAFFEKSHITLLRDQVIALDSSCVVIGRDDKSNSRRQNLSHLMASIPSDMYTIVMDHQPTALDESISHGVSLHLSAHTHMGQVWPLSLVVPHLFKQSYGQKQWNQTTAIVTSGLGLWGGLFRIGTQSEIICLDLI